MDNADSTEKAEGAADGSFSLCYRGGVSGSVCRLECLCCGSLPSFTAATLSPSLPSLMACSSLSVSSLFGRIPLCVLLRCFESLTGRRTCGDSVSPAAALCSNRSIATELGGFCQLLLFSRMSDRASTSNPVKGPCAPLNEPVKPERVDRRRPAKSSIDASAREAAGADAAPALPNANQSPVGEGPS